MTTDIDKIIEKLKANTFLSIREIFEANPYSSSSPISNLSSSELELFFRKELFYELKEYQEPYAQLTNFLDKRNDFAKNLIFIMGFSGTGKSTFIHWAKDKLIKEGINIQTVNFGTHLDSSIKKPWSTYFMRNLSKNRDILPELISFLFSIRDDLINIFNDLYLWLDENPNMSKDESPLEIFKRINTELREESQGVLYWICSVVFHKRFNWDLQKVNLIIFDNVDFLEVDYFSKNFKVLFLNLSANLDTLMAQPSFEKYLLDHNISLASKFSHLFRWCYVMRDTTRAVVSHYIVPHNRRWIKNAIGEINLSFSTTLCFPRRCTAAAKLLGDEIFTKEMKEIGEFLAKDTSVITLFRTGVNYSQRKLFDFIRYCISRPNVRNDIKIYRKQIYRKDKQPINGLLSHHYISYLKEFNYLYKYVYYIEEFDNRKAYYNPLRTILTIIQNHCISKKFDLKLSTPQSKPTTLYDVATAAYPIFTYKEILNAINAFYLPSDYGSSHLVTIFNKVIRTIDDWETEYKKLVLLTNEYLKDKRKKKELEEELKKVEIQLTPAGMIYLHHVVRHFEFYSILKEKDYEPLYKYSHFDHRTQKFDFEEIIKDVFLQVEECFNKMSLFYKNTIRPTLGNPKQFRNSILNYRFQIPHSENNSQRDRTILVKKQTGTYHSMLLIHTHIGYIDDFRANLLADNKELIPKINIAMMRLIRLYLGLLNKVLLSKQETLYDIFLKKVEIIEDNPYDTVTRISKTNYN